MKIASRMFSAVAGCVILIAASGAEAQDWPQWRGPHRDAKVTGFEAPKNWPAELTKKWTVEVGRGDSTPALVGEKLYVFSRQEGNEITRCLDANTGEQIWQDKYVTEDATGPAGRHPGPRSSPAVAEGKVVTLGVVGILSCLDADAGKGLWRINDFQGNSPDYFTACSPIIVDGLCIVQLGSEKDGAVVAYDLTTGSEKWKWTGDGTAYASPALLDVDGVRAIVAVTAKSVVALDAVNGKLLFQTPFAGTGRLEFNAASPIVQGQTLIYGGSGRGSKAAKIEKRGDEWITSELWSNPETSVQYNTAVLKDGLLFGLTQRNSFFCLNAADGSTAWSEPVAARGRSRGFGSIIDAGPVLLALTPSAQLLVLEPSADEYKELASYQVADPETTYAYPVVSGYRIYVKDQNAVTLWTIE